MAASRIADVNFPYTLKVVAEALRLDAENKNKVDFNRLFNLSVLWHCHENKWQSHVKQYRFARIG